jgi:hypothetical protein
MVYAVLPDHLELLEHREQLVSAAPLDSVALWDYVAPRVYVV